MKYIFVIGGVVSGLGKGITAASIGLLLKNAGFKVTAIKIDPYISIDAGTMRPQEHGEVFVTNDGGEIDQDLGNYERFLNENFTKDHNITTGKVYLQVINNERQMVYGGRDAEVIPDVIDEIKRRIYSVSGGYDFAVVEVGGTVGDIENQPFLIAAREIGREHKAAYLMVSYVPYLRNVGEMKTKPTQHAVMLLRQVGVNPDFIVTRAEEAVDEPRLENIAKRCFIDRERIFDVPDMKSPYLVPELLARQEVAQKMMKFFGVRSKDQTNKNYMQWQKFARWAVDGEGRAVKVALVGKYVKHGAHDHMDTYKSVLDALVHASFKTKVKLELEMISSDDLNEENYYQKLKVYGGIVVPQGWGKRGYEGKILAIKYARENKVPYLGLCYGMQMAVIEGARNLAGLKGANSEEVDGRCKDRVIHIMENQKKHLAKREFGGTIRLGAYPCLLMPGSMLEGAYLKFGKIEGAAWFRGEDRSVVYERHRHRYEFNNKYRECLEKRGMIISGISPDGNLVEAIEYSNHPYFVATQFHPEYISRPLAPHPLFCAFLAAVKI